MAEKVIVLKMTKTIGVVLADMVEAGVVGRPAQLVVVGGRKVVSMSVVGGSGDTNPAGRVAPVAPEFMAVVPAGHHHAEVNRELVMTPVAVPPKPSIKPDRPVAPRLMAVGRPGVPVRQHVAGEPKPELVPIRLPILVGLPAQDPLHRPVILPDAEQWLQPADRE